MSLRMTCAISFYYGNSHTHIAEKGAAPSFREREETRRFYTEPLLHTESFTHKHFYTQTLSHRDVFHAHTHTDAFPHRDIYTKTL